MYSSICFVTFFHTNQTIVPLLKQLLLLQLDSLKTGFSLNKRNLSIPADIYLLKVNYRNTRTRCEICSNLTIKTLERRHWGFGVFIVNSEHISDLILVFPLLTSNIQLSAEISRFDKTLAPYHVNFKMLESLIKNGGKSENFHFWQEGFSFAAFISNLLPTFCFYHNFDITFQIGYLFILINTISMIAFLIVCQKNIRYLDNKILPETW